MADWNWTYLPYVIFEMVVVGCLFSLWVIALRRYREKRKELAKILTIFLGLYIIALAFLIVGQFLRLFPPEPVFPADSYIDYFLKTISNAFIFGANFVFSKFYENVYATVEELQRKGKWFLVFTVFGIGFSFVMFPASLVVIGLLLMVHSLILYVPTTFKAYRTYKKIEEESKWAFFFLFLNALFFVFLWFFQVANLIWDEVTKTKFGPMFPFTWIFILLVGINSYIGYLYPKWFQRLVKRGDGPRKPEKIELASE